MEAAPVIGPDLIKRIQNTRKELLDLSSRNRLISTPRGSAPGRKIDIVDERSEAVFRLLVRERKSMSFLAGVAEPENAASDDPAGRNLEQPDDILEKSDTLDPRHTDLRLQTRLASERLQARLLAMYYDAQTYEQEQGVSILYLATGFLKWYESASSDKARYAPLLLIPVDLERASAASRFHLRYRDEDVTTNLSLQAKLKGDFGIALPDVPEMEEILTRARIMPVRAPWDWDRLLGSTEVPSAGRFFGIVRTPDRNLSGLYPFQDTTTIGRAHTLPSDVGDR